MKSDSLDTKCVSEIKQMGMNGIPVAPYGLILGENEATPSRKLFKHLPDLKTTINIKKKKYVNKINIKQQKTKKLPINRPSGRYLPGPRAAACAGPRGPRAAARLAWLRPWTARALGGRV